MRENNCAALPGFDNVAPPQDASWTRCAGPGLLLGFSLLLSSQKNDSKLTRQPIACQFLLWDYTGRNC